MNKDNIIRESSITFKLIWKNKYLRNIIFNYLKLFSIYYSKRHLTINELLNHPFKSYLREIDLKSYGHQSKDEKMLDTILPMNIESIECSIASDNSSSKLLVPSWIKQLDTNYQLLVFEGSSKLENLIQHETDLSKVVSSGYYPDSITDLTFNYARGELRNEMLPINLKRLDIRDSKITLFEPLPVTLIELYLNDNKFTIQDSMQPNPTTNYLPTTLRKLVLENEFTSNQDLSGLESLTYLEITTFKLDFKLPDSLKELKATTGVVKVNIIPSSLEYLFIGRHHYSSKVIFDSNALSSNIKLKKLECMAKSEGLIDSNLPNSIEHLELQHLDFELKPNQLPSSLKWLTLNGFNNNGNKFNIGIGNGNSGRGGNDKGSRGNSKGNRGNSLFPSSLTYLNLNDMFNQSIGVNILPSKLKTLILGKHFDKEIIANSIPNSCELLSILNQNYDHYPIKLNNPSKTIIQSYGSFKHYNHHPESLNEYKIPSGLNDPIERLHLVDKFNLQVLDLDNWWFDRELLDVHLPKNNKIKILKVGDSFSRVIDLNIFQHLETIELSKESTPQFNLGDNNNFYNLKQIIVPYNNTQFLDTINSIFYSYIKLKRK